MRRLWLCVAAMLFVGQSQAYMIWRSVGPRTASPLAAVATDSVPTVVLCAVANGTRVSLLSSTDNGQTWPVLVDSLRFRPWAITFAPGDRQVLYTAAGGLWRSTNQGLTWSPLTTPAGRFYFGVGIDRRRPSDVWAAGHAATALNGQAVIARSTDLGVTWSELVCDSLHRSDAQSVARDPTTDSVVYCGGTLAGQAVVWKSTDLGGSWMRATLPVALHDSIEPDQPPPQQAPLKGAVHSLYVNPLTPNVVTAAVDWAGLCRSTDAGMSWVRQVGFNEAHSLVFSTRQPNVGLVGLINRVLVTSNGGANWSDVWDPPGGGVVRCLAVAADSSMTSWCATPSSIYRSTNGGLKWYAAKVLCAGRISALRVSRYQPQNVFAAVAGDNLYRSTDDGASWAACTPFPGSASIVSLAVRTASEVWALDDSGLYRSTNLGVSWTPVGDWFDRPGAVAFSFDLPGVGVAAGSRYDSAHGLRLALVCTKDGGRTWTSAPDSMVGSATAVTSHAGNPAMFSIGGDSAGCPLLVETRDTGRTWLRSARGLQGRVNDVVARENVFRWCATDSGVFRSTWGDSLWHLAGQVIALANCVRFVNYSDDVVASSDSGVFLFTGSTWWPYGEGLADAEVVTLDAYEDWGYMYAGTGAAGLFQTHQPVGLADDNSPPPGLLGRPHATLVRGVLWLGAGTVPKSGASDALGLSRAVLLDITGRKVAALHPGANDVRHLAPGVYFVLPASGVMRDASRVERVSKVIVTR